MQEYMELVDLRLGEANFAIKFGRMKDNQPIPVSLAKSGAEALAGLGDAMKTVRSLLPK